jgi:hypothetical protein
MAEDLAHEFLLKEYENAAQVTFRADDFRDKLSTFFLSFAGAAVVLVGLIVQDSIKVEYFGAKELTTGVFLVGVGTIGLLILCVHARLRRVQLEHFAMINRIRLYCVRENVDLWNTIGLSMKTLPKVRLISGSELWALTILLPTAVLFAMAGDFLLRWRHYQGAWHLIPVGVGVVVSGLLWWLYAALAKAPAPQIVEPSDVEEWLTTANLAPTQDWSSAVEEEVVAYEEAEEMASDDVSSESASIVLPEVWRRFLDTLPASGRGFHRVDVWFEGGHVVPDVCIFNALTMELPLEYAEVTIQDIRPHSPR